MESRRKSADIVGELKPDELEIPVIYDSFRHVTHIQIDSTKYEYYVINRDVHPCTKIDMN